MITLLKIWESAAETTHGNIPSGKYNGLNLEYPNFSTFVRLVGSWNSLNIYKIKLYSLMISQGYGLTHKLIVAGFCQFLWTAGTVKVSNMPFCKYGLAHEPIIVSFY